jgi:POLQ-like helicase
LTHKNYFHPQKPKHEKKLPIQIVATTATLENKKELSDFLKAYLYERNFRPVELREFIKLESQIFEVDKTRAHLNEELENIVKLDRELDTKLRSAELKRDDPDNIVDLVKEVIPDQSCLIFCSTKKNCENLASLLCSHLPKELKTHKRDLKLKLFNELREENSNNICSVLRQSLQYGIAYHHSGLTTEERQLIEQAYRDGVLCLITCTSTLAAGVNLPAKRVIIRSPYVAIDFISTHQYRQMIGRAGRAGLIDSGGESILVFKNIDRVKVLDLISGPMKRCESSFQGDDCKAIRQLVLSLIGLNLTHLGSQIMLFFRKTLFFMQQKAKLSKDKKQTLVEGAAALQFGVPKEFDLISSALDYLVKNKLVQVNEADSVKPEVDVDGLDTLYFKKFEVTKLGLAAIKGNVDLDYVHQLYEDLMKGLKTMVLSNNLHLLFLCTPYELAASMFNIDYDIYARKVCFFFILFYIMVKRLQVAVN